MHYTKQGEDVLKNLHFVVGSVNLVPGSDFDFFVDSSPVQFLMEDVDQDFGNVQDEVEDDQVSVGSFFVLAHAHLNFMKRYERCDTFQPQRASLDYDHDFENVQE